MFFNYLQTSRLFGIKITHKSLYRLCLDDYQKTKSTEPGIECVTVLFLYYSVLWVFTVKKTKK